MSLFRLTQKKKNMDQRESSSTALESAAKTLTEKMSPYLLYSPIAHPCWSGIFPGLFSLWRRAPVWGYRGLPVPQLWPRCLESQPQQSSDKVDRGKEGLALHTAGRLLLNSASLCGLMVFVRPPVLQFSCFCYGIHL